MMPGMPERRTHDYARHGVTSLFAAFNIEDRHRDQPSCTAATAQPGIPEVPQADRQERPGPAWTSTWSATTTARTDPGLQDWLGKHPRFHVHFTPTGSSWINQVERWFGLTSRTRKIRRGVHRSPSQALEADIRDWIEHLEPEPPPLRLDEDTPRRSSTPRWPNICSKDFRRGH